MILHGQHHNAPTAAVRKRLFPLIKQVNDDRVPVEIISNHGRAYPGHGRGLAAVRNIVFHAALKHRDEEQVAALIQEHVLGSIKYLPGQQATP